MSKHKNLFFICLFIFLAIGSITGLFYFKSTKNSGDKAYPYDDSTKYIPSEISHSSHGNIDLIYNQENQVDKYILNIYGTMYDDSLLKRDCYPVYSKRGSVSFSRKSDINDSDEKRYNEMLSYIGKESEKTFISLASLPQNELNTIRCMIFQNGLSNNISAVSAQAPIYHNCYLSIIISKDFDMISDANIKKSINNFSDILLSDKASSIGDYPAALSYVYQTRYSEEFDSTEERYVYYLFFKTEEFEYLIQFTSNYTVLENDKTTYSVSGKSQEECRSFFEKYIVQFTDTCVSH